MTTPEYAEVTQAIADLTNPEKTTDLSADAIQQKLADLRFQKYILETAESRSTCSNQTGKTLGIYAKAKKSAPAPTLYYLADGETTDDDVECVGIYLPGTSKIVADKGIQELPDAVAIKVVPGTQLIASANPETGIVELNVPASGTFKASEIDWEIPASTPAEIDAQIPNAPVD